MKKLIITSLAVMVAAVGLTGCFGDSTTPTTLVTTTQLQEQIVALEAKLLTVENKTNTAVQSSALTDIKNDIATLKSQVSGLTAGVSQTQVNTSITGALTSVNQSIAALTARIDALEATDAPAVANVFTVAVQAGTNGILITTNSPELTKGYFELTYILTGVHEATGASVNDALIWLSTNPVLKLQTGATEILPVYQLAYADSKWRVMSVTFRTAETTVAAGESSKTALYALAPVFTGYWTVDFTKSNSAPVSGGW